MNIAIARFILFGTPFLALVACDDQRTEQVNQPAKASTDGKEMTATRSGYADVNGVRFHYQIFGDLNSGKVPLLVLHGSYMSADSMAPLIRPLAHSRTVIALDARGHGRTGDLPGPITYEQMADDSAGVLEALNVRRADVIGYSMGGTTAIAMAVRHPDKVGKQIILSGASRRDGWHPEVHEALQHMTPAAFAGTPLEAEYKRLSPTPSAFPLLVQKLRDLDLSNYDTTNDAVRKIGGKTMIVAGDADAVQLEHAIELFKLRGGIDKKVVTQGFMTEAPRARLAILPGTSHVGIMANADLIAALATPFLDDSKPTTPPGFLKQ
jgi:pimeloyl-ACP methyl ester carboxylesterase